MKNKESSTSDKKFVGFLVSEETKSKWDNFVSSHNYKTVSKLIREAVNFYVDSHAIISYIRDLPTLTHNLKEPLTSIKGFSQIILEKYANKLDLDIIFKLNEVIKQSEYLEKKINQISLDHIIREIEEFDVLIVDDNIPTTIYLSELFAFKGITSKIATNGENALELLKMSKPKVILLDIILPDFNGYEICKKIKFDSEYEDFKEIPVYYITAVEESIVQKHMKETRATGYLLKPFVISDFNFLFNILAS